MVPWFWDVCTKFWLLTAHDAAAITTHQTRLANLSEPNLQFTALSFHKLPRCFSVRCIFSDMLSNIPWIQQIVHGLTASVTWNHSPPTSGINRERLPWRDCIIVFVWLRAKDQHIQKISDQFNWHKQLSYIRSLWNNLFSPRWLHFSAASAGAGRLDHVYRF